MKPTRQIIHHQHRQPNSIVLRKRRTMKKFRPQALIDRTLYSLTIYSLITTAFLGVTALGCWGLEIIDSNSRPTILRSHDWQSQKNICLGGMALSFSVFLGSALLGACLSSDGENNV